MAEANLREHALKVSLDTMHKTPGIWVLVGRSIIFFVEVDAEGRCFQLNPDTFERDGQLERDGWSGNPVIVGPLARPQDWRGKALAAGFVYEREPLSQGGGETMRATPWQAQNLLHDLLQVDVEIKPS